MAEIPPIVEKQRKLPPYNILKGLFLGGMSYTQIAERYGCSKRAAEMTLRKRALSRGEWPLLTEERRLRRRHLELTSRADNVRVDVIRELLRCFLRNNVMTTSQFADRFGFHPLFVRDVRSPRGHTTITVANAVRILDAIGEPVPNWMREPLDSTG